MTGGPPLEPEGWEPAGPEPMTVEAPPEPRRPRWLRYVVATVAVVVLLAVATSVVVAVQRGRFGPRMATAAALPPSTAMYMSFDLEGLGNFDRLIDAFDQVVAEAGLDPDADVLDLIDEMVLGEFGMSVADFEPWIGRDVGVAILDLNLDEEGFLGDPGAAVVAASVRDQDEADLFMPKMVRAMNDLGLDFEQDTYEDVALWVSGDDPAALGVAGRIVLGRSGDLMLMATNERAMREAIDAHNGESLRDADAFRTVVDELPGDRAVTMYMGRDLFQAFADLATNPAFGGVNTADIQQTLDNLAGAGASLSLADEGVRLDFVQVAVDAGDEPGFAPQAGSERIAAALPADTFAFVGIGEWDVAGAFAQFEQALSDAGMDQQVDEIVQGFGIDIERDLVALLTGELGLGLFPSSGGPVAAAGGPPVGGLVLLGLTDPDAFGRTIERFNQIAADNGVPIEEQQTDSGVVYGISPDGGDPLWYGISGGFFAAGTDRALAGATGSERLVDTALWEETRGALDTDGAPLFYVDLGAALTAFGADAQVRSDLEPLRAMAAAAVTGDGVTRVTLIALIDY